MIGFLGDRLDVSTMLTIPAMVRVGPWVLECIQRDPNSTKCERCSQRIKEVWQCTVDADETGILNELDGRATWRIGSTCGPTLLGISNEVWKQNTQALKSRLNQLIKVVALIQESDAVGFELQGRVRTFLEEYERSLRDGTISEREVRHCGLIRARQERALEAYKRGNT